MTSNLQDLPRSLRIDIFHQISSIFHKDSTIGLGFFSIIQFLPGFSPNTQDYQPYYLIINNVSHSYQPPARPFYIVNPQLHALIPPTTPTYASLPQQRPIRDRLKFDLIIVSYTELLLKLIQD